MASGQSAPAAGFKFNNIQEIKSHSSVLFNERLAILFYLLDMKSIELNTSHNLNMMLEVRALIKQIYKNIRMLILYNPICRMTLNLETKDTGVFVPDVALGIIDKMIEYCETNGYTQKKIFIITGELNNVEMMIKNVLQYFHYFIRPDFSQKPEIDLATEKYKEIADQRTIDELRELAGKKHRIDFEGLGTEKLIVEDEIEYDETVDGPEDEEEPEEEDNY